MYMNNPKVNDLHSDGLNILEDDINDIPETSMNKPKDPHSDGLDETPGYEMDKKELKKILVLYNYKYTKKRKLGEAIFEIITNDDEIDQKLQHEYEQILELGKAIHEIINNYGVHQQSLRPEFFKEALDLYMKTSVESFPENIEFKPWQMSIQEEVEIPQKKNSRVV